MLFPYPVTSHHHHTSIPRVVDCINGHHSKEVEDITPLKKGKIFFPFFFDLGFEHMTCFGQWNVSGSDMTKDLKCACVIGLFP